MLYVQTNYGTYSEKHIVLRTGHRPAINIARRNWNKTRTRKRERERERDRERERETQREREIEIDR